MFKTVAELGRGGGVAGEKGGWGYWHKHVQRKKIIYMLTEPGNYISIIVGKRFKDSTKEWKQNLSGENDVLGDEIEPGSA